MKNILTYKQFLNEEYDVKDYDFYNSSLDVADIEKQKQIILRDGVPDEDGNVKKVSRKDVDEMFWIQPYPISPGLPKMKVCFTGHGKERMCERDGVKLNISKREVDWYIRVSSKKILDYIDEDRPYTYMSSNCDNSKEISGLSKFECRKKKIANGTYKEKPREWKKDHIAYFGREYGIFIIHSRKTKLNVVTAVSRNNNSWIARVITVVYQSRYYKGEPEDTIVFCNESTGFDELAISRVTDIDLLNEYQQLLFGLYV